MPRDSRSASALRSVPTATPSRVHCTASSNQPAGMADCVITKSVMGQAGSTGSMAGVAGFGSSAVAVPAAVVLTLPRAGAAPLKL